MSQRTRDALLLGLAVLLAWQLGAAAAGDTALASPRATFARALQLAARPAFWTQAATTGLAFLLAASLSVGGGVLLGCALGLSRLLGRVMQPVLASLYALPKVTLYPVVLLLFGLGLSAQVAMGVMHGLIPVALLTMNAVLQVRPVHLRTARAMRLRTGQLLRTVVLPAIVPDMLGGVRLGVPLALLGVLIGEMFASRTGLGAMAMRAMETNDGPTLLAIALLLSAAALAINAALAAVTAGRVPGAARPAPARSPPGTPGR